MHYQNFHLVFDYHQYSSHKDIPVEMQQFLIYLIPNVPLKFVATGNVFVFLRKQNFLLCKMYTLVV